MSSEHPQDPQGSADGAARTTQPARYEATVVVRGEGAPDQVARGDAKGSPDHEDTPRDKPTDKAKILSAANVQRQNALPALADDAEIGVQKDQRVTRDGKAYLAFLGTLRASAAPASAAQGQWQEYRIYETNGGKHVFSKITRNVDADQVTTHEADIFDPTPESVSSKLMRSARDLTHSRPMTWEDAAVAFFGYDPLAKALYRKLSGRFEEQIT